MSTSVSHNDDVKSIESENISISDDKSMEENLVHLNNSIDNIIEDLERLTISYNTINEKLKNNSLELTKDNYVSFNKYILEINKGNCLINNIILKKSLKNCISKKNAKKKKNSSVETRKRVYSEILNIMEIEAEDNMISQKDIMNYISSYIKSQRLIDSSGILVKDKNLKYFNLTDKLKSLFLFIKDRVNEIEKNKEKVEKLFPNNQLPEFLTYTNLMVYYPYFFQNN
jgi:hypothetical protein